MNGKDNLVPVTMRSKEEARAISSKGGIASGKSRRKKKLFRECFDELLSGDVIDKDGTVMMGVEKMAAVYFKKGIQGDLPSAIFVRDTVGQKPVEKVVTAEVDEEALAEVERIVNGGKDD